MIGHGVLVWLVVLGWSATTEKKIITKPSYIKATLVAFEQKAKPVVKDVIKPKPDEALKKKREAAAKKQRLQKEKEKKAAKRKAEQKKAAEANLRKNQLAKKREEEKKKKDTERKKLEKAEKDKQNEEEEALRKAALQKDIEQERQRELEKSITAEKARLKADEQAAADAELAESYHSVIHDKVSANWSRPPSARNGMSALLRIQLVPTGEVISVDVIDGSGDAAFDRSASLAVNKAENFPELQNLPIHVFEKNFRMFNLLFKPQDLRQ
jgi:colicin import membrane protein